MTVFGTIIFSFWEEWAIGSLRIHVARIGVPEIFFALHLTWIPIAFYGRGFWQSVIGTSQASNIPLTLMTTYLISLIFSKVHRVLSEGGVFKLGGLLQFTMLMLSFIMYQ